MRAIVSKLRRKLLELDRVERCGLVLKSGRVFQVENEHPDPAKGFKIPARELMKHEADLLGSWHTHPGEGANLSQEDYTGFEQWPNLIHFVIGVDGVRAWKFDGPLLVEVDLD